MLILNSGGTFSKRYNKVNGDLEVPYDNNSIIDILKSTSIEYSLAGIVYKDSLEMDFNDRKMLADIIRESNEKFFILIHGTDTMHLTAEFFDELFDDIVIVITGAMKPFEIDKVEASLNLGMAIGFVQGNPLNGTYICMSGFIKNYVSIEKNHSEGKFQVV
jgi:L-asparaginase